MTIKEPTQTTPMDTLRDPRAYATGMDITSPVLLSSARRSWVESISLLFAHWKLIALVAVIVTVATGYYAFTQPNVYTATTVVLPPRKSSSGLDGIAAGLSSTIKDLGITKIGGGMDGGAYSPLALASSRELRETIVNRFQLVKDYEVLNTEDAVGRLSASMTAEVTPFATFAISVVHTDPAKAAAMANAVVEELNATSSELAVEEAKINRAFVEQRFMKCLADLDSAERALDRFQRQYGVYSMPEQAKAQVTAIAALEQQKYTAEVQYNMVQEIYGQNAPEALALQSTVNDLASKLSDLKVGADKQSSFVATNMLPAAAMDYLRTMREVELQSKLKAFLLPTFEQAKLDETKRSVAFLVLDKAVAPIRKSGPKRSVMLLMAMFGSVIVTSIALLYAHKLKAARRRFTVDQQSLGLR